MVAASVPDMSLQIAFQADVDGAPTNWTWTDIPNLREYNTKRGKQNQHGRMEAGTLQATVDNRERDLDPMNTASPYYGTFLALDGTSGCYVDCPDPGNVTGDIEIIIRFKASTYVTGTNRMLLDQVSGTTGWRLYLNSFNNGLLFQWYEGATLRSVFDDGPALVDNQAYWMKITLDVNNGAGGHTVRFYESTQDTNDPNAVLWTKRSTDLSAAAGTTSITASSAVCRIGADTSGNNRFTGWLWYAKVLNGSTVLVNPDFTFGWASQYTTSLTKADTAASPNTWTLRGTAVLWPDTDFGSWVQPGRPIRLRATIDGIGTYNVFTGTIEGAPALWPDGPFDDGAGDAVVTFTAVDAFKRLADSKVLPYPSTVRKIGPTGPLAYWRFDEISAIYDNVDSDMYKLHEDTANHSTGPHNMTGILKAVNVETPSIVSGIVNTSARLSDAAGIYEEGISILDTDWLKLPKSYLPGGTKPFTVAGWIQPDLRGLSSHPYGVIFWVAAYGSGVTSYADGGRIIVYLDHSTFKLKFLVRNGNTGTTAAINLTSTTSVSTSQALHPTATFFVCARDENGYGHLYINGVEEASGLSAAMTGFDPTVMAIGDLYASDTSLAGGSDHYTGLIDELAVWNDHAMTAEEVADLYDKGTSQFQSGVLPYERVTSLLDVAGWPTAARVIAGDGSARLSSFDQTDSVLNGLFEAADAEDGEVFVDVDGSIRFDSRTHRRTLPLDFALTFGDQADLDTEVPYTDLVIPFDDDAVINEAIMTLKGNSDYEFTHLDHVSRKRHGLKSFEKEVALTTGSDAKNLAEEIVRRNKTAVPRVDSLTIKSGASLLNSIAAFAYDLNWLGQVYRTPPNNYLPKGLYFTATGDYASTPDVAALDITGDLEIQARFSLDDLTPTGNPYLVSKGGFTTAGGYYLRILSTGVLRLGWSTGTTAFTADSTVALSTIAEADDVIDIKVTLDVNNGAGGKTVTFYYSKDRGLTWTALGSAVTTASTTSIGTNSTAVSIGAFSTGTDPLIGGTLHRLIVRNGIGGTTALDVDFTSASQGWTAGDTAAATGTDSTGKTVTLYANSRILHDRIRIPAFIIGIEHDGDARKPAAMTTTFTLMNAEPYRNTWKLGTTALGQGALAY